MGERKKKSEGEKKAEEAKNQEAEKTEKAEKAAAEETAKVEDKKTQDGNNKEKDKKDSKEEEAQPAPEIVLRVFMHCEGCARKVKKCLKGFDGVEDVMSDCKTHKVVVKGEKADPLKVLSRLQKKTHRQVDLLSPIPKPPTQLPKKPEGEEPPKPEEKIQEPKVITVVLKVHMHCEACSLEIKKRIERMKEVEEAIPDLKNSQVTVKGTFAPPKLVDYVYKRTGKHATIVKQDPPQEKKEENAKTAKDGTEEKKGENGEEEKKSEQKGEEAKGDKKEEAVGGQGGGEGGKPVAEGGDGAVSAAEEGPKIVELKKNEFTYYPPRYAMEMYAYPPQIFSDENPNACCIM